MRLIEIIFSVIIAGIIILLYLYLIRQESRNKKKYYIGCDLAADGSEDSTIVVVSQKKCGAIEIVHTVIVSKNEDFEAHEKMFNSELTRVWEKYNKCPIYNEIPEEYEHNTAI